jgi:hypothetical protein
MLQQTPPVADAGTEWLASIHLKIVVAEAATSSARPSDLNGQHHSNRIMALTAEKGVCCADRISAAKASSRYSE